MIVYDSVSVYIVCAFRIFVFAMQPEKLWYFNLNKEI